MKYFLSTKYKLGKIELDENQTVIHGGTIFKEWVGYPLQAVKDHFNNPKYPVKLIPIAETIGV